MDRRRRPVPIETQLALREQALNDVLAHPEWTPIEVIRHVRRTLGLTTAELAQLAEVGFRTLQDLEQGRTDGTVRTVSRLLGVLGLRLGVRVGRGWMGSAEQRAAGRPAGRDDEAESAGTR